MIRWEALGRVAIFIDYANIIHSYKDLGWRIDFLKLMEFVKKKGMKLNGCFFFDAVDKVKEDQVRFQKKLKSFGYHLSVKPLQRNHVAKILIKAANSFISLDKLRNEIEFEEGS